jgi:hypothetical protein
VAQPLLQRRQHLGGADLLQGGHVGLLGVEHLGEGGDLASKASGVGGPSGVPAANRFCTFQLINRNSATPTPPMLDARSPKRAPGG